MRRLTALVIVALALVAIGGACDDDDSDPAPTVTPTTPSTATASPTGTPTVSKTPTATPTPAATETATATGEPTPPPDDFSLGIALGRQSGGGTCEAVLPLLVSGEALELGSEVSDVFVCIAEPKPGATVGEAIEVRGYQAGSFEQNVVIELRDAAGDAIAITFTTANAPDLGLIVGEWSATLDVPAGADLEGATLAAFATSARDGSIDFGGEIQLGN